MCDAHALYSSGRNATTPTQGNIPMPTAFLARCAKCVSDGLTYHSEGMVKCMLSASSIDQAVVTASYITTPPYAGVCMHLLRMVGWCGQL